MSEQPAADERRQFFRVDDDVIFSWRRFDDGATDSDDDARLDRFRQLLIGIDPETDVHLADIRNRAPGVGEVLDYLNNKVSLIARLWLEREDKRWHQHTGTANLSGGGMAFDSEQRFAVGEKLMVELVLLPACHVLTCEAEVVSCRPEEGMNAVSIRFEGLAERQQDLIVRHVFQRHSHVLKAERDARLGGASS